MELGKAKLLRTGLNSLHQALHPVHGIAWTDGKQVCLTSFYFVNGEPKFGDTNVIGQFEHVFGLFWGPLCCSDSPALLAVQHKKHVTVWQLQLSALEQNKLLCTQTCEMSEPFPLLSQGCVWHPKQDILAVLTKRDTSVLFSVRVDNRRVKADIKGSGLIHCACWTKDGTRLVVAIGTGLHSYIWNDIQKSLVACSFCPIFDVGGYICAIESTDDAQVAVATELPLDKICGLNAGMAFEMPSDPDQLPSPSPVVMFEDDNLDSRRRSFDSDRSLSYGYNSPTSGGPMDLTHLLSKHRKSDPSPLIHLRRRDTLTGTGQDSSHLILVTYERKVTTTRKVSIPGILVPDIIAFDPRGGTVAVASNTCNMILVYCVTASGMPNVQQIQMEKNERPKGVCFLSNKLLMLMVGRQKSNDPAFLPSSNTDKFILRLMTKELLFDGETIPPSPQAPASPVNFPGTRRHSEHFPKDDRLGGGVRELMLPGGGVIPSPGSSRRKLVEEVVNTQSPAGGSPGASSTDFSDRATSSASSVTIEPFDMDHMSRMATLAVGGQTSRESSRPSSPRFDLSMEKLLSEPPPVKNNNLPRDKAVDQLSQGMEKIFARFSEVQQSLTEIRDYAQNGRKAIVNYPCCAEPPYINLTFQKQLSENVFIDERRPVLLCEGKLSLKMIQELFSLTVVEMLHGPLWIVLVADAEGFVPLTFKPGEHLTIRNGKRNFPLKGHGGQDASSTERQFSSCGEH
ncbi:WD repeat and coiled-coil-containing protein [Alosa sapidissima]|uniref:WD repeat and coiled-coil-containing protein n=1 Tax=Alosa sapidissima TaxID=34773 RepID=UPI001C0A2ECE|nr:WD repeat and coiled-coil-containing protein [Alosa sapidissima]XP_041952184.1 WD repeat and coiled-coil-containing protein [Alosa sapidissima]